MRQLSEKRNQLSYIMMKLFVGVYRFHVDGSHFYLEFFFIMER